MLHETEPLSEKMPLNKRIYQEIKMAITTGRLAPGQRLSEPELALTFETSRSPIREALGQLEHDGFVQRRPNGRVYVTPLDEEELRNISAIRSVVEGLATRLAAARLRSTDLEEMGEKLSEMDRRLQAGDIKGAIAAGEEFHDVIQRECGNPQLVDIIARMRGFMERYRLVVASFEEYDPARLAEHRQILQALYDRDGGTAEKLMIEHISKSADTLHARLKPRR